MNIGIVILHYKTIDKTLDCINSFFAQKKDEFDSVECVVVDNGSNDDSEKRIKEHISRMCGFRALVLSHNIVFSKAMDEGVKELNSIFNGKMDFLILSNNDILFEGDDLYSKIKHSYDKFGFAVMGPDIYSASTKAYSNPITKKPNNGLLYNILSLLKSDFDILTKKWKKVANTREISNENHFNVQLGSMLHGSFLVFSRKYLEVFPNGLYPQNSFYMEENLLFFLCTKYKLKMVYDPSIYILHIHSITISNMFNNDQLKKKRFVALQQRKSKKTLIKIIFKTKIGLQIHF